MTTTITHLLPEDVVVDIEARLPVKSLKRFRCVSKSWCSLIQNPEFTTLHYFFSKKKTCPLVVERVEEKIRVSFLSNQTLDVVLANLDVPSFATDKLVDFRGFCNGILCFQRNFGQDILLWNFATKESKILPTCPLDYMPGYHSHIGAVGFGYDSKRDDYKVTRIRTYREVDNGGYLGDYNMHVALYSLKTDSWKMLDGHLTGHDVLGFGFCPGFYLNGFYHCRATINQKGVMVSFDMSNEVFITTPYPDGGFGSYEKPPFCEFFMEINGSVGGLICLDDSVADSRYDVWVLGEVGLKNSWTKLFTIGPIYEICMPAGAGSNGTFFVSTDKNFLVSWHLPSNQEIKTLQFEGFVTKVAMYAESLVSPRGGTPLISTASP